MRTIARARRRNARRSGRRRWRGAAPRRRRRGDRRTRGRGSDARGHPRTAATARPTKTSRERPASAGLPESTPRPVMLRRRDRGAPRLRRSATSAAGFGGHFGAPCSRRVTEERPDSLGARRAPGGLGRFRGPPCSRRVTEERPDSSGRDERGGVWGAISGPPMFATRDRGAPRFIRGTTSAGGFGGPFRGPPCS